MTKCVIDVDGYWTVILFINTDYDNFERIRQVLEDIECPDKIINNIYNKIAYKLDSGVTFTKSNLRTSVVCINEASSREELINTISHEADHVQAHICKYYDISLDSEDAAYLIGYLVSRFYRCSSRLFCYN